MRKRPDVVHSITARQSGPKEGENIYITFGIDSDMVLLEVFITRGKAGTDEAADAEWVARIISTALQSMGPDQVQPFLQTMIKRSVGIQGAGIRYLGGGRKVLSAPDAVAQAFALYYENAYGQSYLEPIKTTKGENDETRTAGL